MERLPEHVVANMRCNKHYYSLYSMENLERCKVDEVYLGEALLANEDLIWHSVHKYIGKPEVIVSNNCIEKDDILQLGRLGFIKAINAFDTTRGIKFSSFAVTAIVREIRCFLRDSGSIVRPTRTANELMYKIYKVEQELGYLPSVADLADLMDEEEEKITKAISIGRSVKYLDEPVTSGQDFAQTTLLDFIPGDSPAIDDDVIDRVYVDTILNAVKAKLTDKEISIVRRRVSGLNQTQTAQQENVSQMRVNRVMKKVARMVEEHMVIEGS